MSKTIEKFTTTVQRFCQWVESDQHDLVEARQFLISLMNSIPDLAEFRYDGETDLDFPRRGPEGWGQDHKKFSDLPFQYYRSIFDPHDLESSSRWELGDLHDDLADIYGDLWEGLQAHQSGAHKEALSLWIDSYFIHWGHHASGALNAIDIFYRQNSVAK